MRSMRHMLPNISLQPTVIPLRGLPAAELRRLEGCCVF
jgi:hypothetical protein